MPIFLCNHCGQENKGENPYCQNCGALRESNTTESTVPSSPTEKVEPELDPVGLSEELPSTTPPSKADTPTLLGETTGSGEPPDQPLLLNVLTGVIPERIVDRFQPKWAPTQYSLDHTDSSTLQEMKSRFGLSESFARIELTGVPNTESLRKQKILYGILLIAAILPFWLSSLSLPADIYTWSGTETAWHTIQALEPDSEVLIFWQNHPGVAGELDLAVAPVLTHLLAVPANLHLFSQHPLGLAQARRLLALVRRGQAVALSEVEISATVNEIGYWPGGYVVLPGLLPLLPKMEPDLHVVITADADDVIHWLEQVGPHTAVPILAITSAGADQLIRPYQDSEQLAGLVRGYSGGQAYAQFNADRFPNLQEKKIKLHMSTQNWVSAALILVFLASMLLRFHAIPSWEQTEFDS